MDLKHILITGGAGFVGANLAVCFKRAFPGISVTGFDNLKRRGSELNLPRLKERGVVFVHGDIRCREDVECWPDFDLLIDCSAEPSVQAGMDGSPLPLIQNNLLGTVHCMEQARRRDAAFLFLSSSRVYPIARLNALAYRETPTRCGWTAEEPIPGLSGEGVAEAFPLEGARSLYGATKLASELLLQEYAYSFQMPVLINRCGILTGPWQMGKVDQGVITLWVARHAFGRGLRYIGFGGQGKQVRDMLHVEDLFSLLIRQIEKRSLWDGRVYNVGGGRDNSVSLAELTNICRQVCGSQVPIEHQPETSPLDLRIYVTDARRATADFDWSPSRGVEATVKDIYAWVRRHEAQLRPILA
jgi:CDP-paratose 2-epimerase